MGSGHKKVSVFRGQTDLKARRIHDSGSDSGDDTTKSQKEPLTATAHPTSAPAFGGRTRCAIALLSAFTCGYVASMGGGSRPAVGAEPSNVVGRIQRDDARRDPRTRDRTDVTSPASSNDHFRHPRAACFAASDEAPSRCRAFPASAEVAARALPPVPRAAKSGGKGGGGSAGTGSGSSGDVVDLLASETKECQLSDPSYQAAPAAPSTCNDVHALGLRWEGAGGVEGGEAYPPLHKFQYLTMGGFRSVWIVTEGVKELEGRRAVLKTNQLHRPWSARALDQNRRDVLVSARAGSAPARGSHVLPTHQYCAFSAVMPFATAGVLDGYMAKRLRDGDLLTAWEQYELALQAARGVHQAHLYRDGRATHAHADVKPPQFLLFARPPARIPTMQLNDFNRGRFLTRSRANNETCPFRMCNVRHRGSLYRSPEEYMKCADQTDRIDVWSLGGIFYYLLSDGKSPWYYIHSYQEGVERWLKGERPRLPEAEEYRHNGEEVTAFVTARAEHPAFLALKEIMTECWVLKPADRPSSLRVVQMLEDRWREMNPSEEGK